MKSLNRRKFLRNSLLSALAVSSRSAVVGVPASFLLAGQVHAALDTPKFTIIAESGQGEASNACGPGTFATNSSNIGSTVEHPNPNEINSSVSRIINGRSYDAQDLATGANVQLGAETVRAARLWNALPQDFRNHLSFFWMRTGTNAHPEFPLVKTCMGALNDDVLTNTPEELASAMAAEVAQDLGTTLTQPMLLDRSGKFKGAPLSAASPTSIKNLFSASSNSTISPENYAALYNQTIDSLHHSNLNPAQRSYLDNHALTQSQAAVIGDQLGDLLEDVNGNGFVDEIKTAIALIRLRVTPVISVRHFFSKDNHGDSTLTTEVTDTLASISALNDYWRLITENNLQDEVNFCTLDVFGRTLRRNSQGGRDHFGNLTLGICHGPEFKGSVIGGMTEGTHRRQRVPVANSINSATGASGGDIPAGSTLAAYGATMLKAAGVADERIALRMPTAKVVSGAFEQV